MFQALLCLAKNSYYVEKLHNFIPYSNRWFMLVYSLENRTAALFRGLLILNEIIWIPMTINKDPRSWSIKKKQK